MFQKNNRPPPYHNRFRSLRVIISFFNRLIEEKKVIKWPRLIFSNSIDKRALNPIQASVSLIMLKICLCLFNELELQGVPRNLTDHIFGNPMTGVVI